MAGSDPALPGTRWFEMVADLLWETVGLGAAYVLDAESTRIFSAAVGENHAARAGTIRTFLPGADLADPGDGIRHRVLSTASIVDKRQSLLTRLFGWRAGDHHRDPITRYRAPARPVLRGPDRSAAGRGEIR